MMDHSWFFPAVAASGYWLLKIYLAFSLARIIGNRFGCDLWSSLVSGWLLVQIAQSSFLFALSSAGMMHPAPFAAAIAILAALILAMARVIPRSGAPHPLPWNAGWHAQLLGTAIFSILALMWLRAVFLYDNTWDGQTYGLPRLAMWLNHGSVFVHMPTRQLNLFVNEWNGELNSLAYGLISGSYMGFAFGNLEVLLVLFFVIAWVAVLLGMPVAWALGLSLVLGSSPAVIGLASVTKGDLLSITAFLMTVGWLVHIRRGGASIPFASGMLLISSAMAVGSKVSVALPVISVFVAAVWTLGSTGTFGKLPRRPLLPYLGVGICLAVLSLRFWMNWAVYGHPLTRMSHERPNFGIDNLFANLKLVSDKLFFDVKDEIRGDGKMLALTAGMGLSAWFVLGLLVVTMLFFFLRQGRRASLTIPNGGSGRLSGHSQKLNGIWIASLAGILLLGVLCTMSLVPAYPFVFRFYAPAIFALLVVAWTVSVKLSFSSKDIALPWVGVILLVTMTNTFIALRPGHIFPADDLEDLRDKLQTADTPLKRATLFHRGPYLAAGIDTLRLDTDVPLEILAFQLPDTSFLPFFGSHAQNRVSMVESNQALIREASKRRWDAVVVLQKKRHREGSVPVQLSRQGYSIAIDNESYMVAVPSPEWRESSRTTPLHWSPWKDVPEARLSLHGGLPQVESRQPTDTGFATQELVFNRVTRIRARFVGEVEGRDSHAAHLSLHGVRPLITLPSGTYTGSELFEVTLTLEEAQMPLRLSFGLGGWTKGSGRLRLSSLELTPMPAE